VAVGQPFDCVVRLTLPRGVKLPTYVDTRVDYQGIGCGMIGLEPTRVAPGVYECRGRLDGMRVLGTYQVVAECVDLYSQRSFFSRGTPPPSEVVVTATATAVLEVRAP
jgi:hypothetical protein